MSKSSFADGLPLLLLFISLSKDLLAFQDIIFKQQQHKLCKISSTFSGVEKKNEKKRN